MRIQKTNLEKMRLLLFLILFSLHGCQNDLLSDERLTAFITHGGMGSTQETAIRGKPGIFIPLFGDQPRNAGMMEYNGLGKVLDKLDLVNPDVIEAAVKDVLTNDTTVEFAAEFGPSSALRPQSYDMSVMEYHNLDILAVSLLILFLIAFTTIKIVGKIFKISFPLRIRKMKTQ
ncbi:hypothetical protein PFISCL1PPCAC_15283 [Pristionchus fissidentatus]|uniref:glucuronosyltransferase n=1 Tax=Pristionchus fissidentatus TaxID=1538716 RepID=A0AAV5VW34_9BILA|nr:hypothetical protein PFISCL1PPCAC_15283 [Pristionchus fissidentatus]